MKEKRFLDANEFETNGRPIPSKSIDAKLNLNHHHQKGSRVPLGRSLNYEICARCEIQFNTATISFSQLKPIIEIGTWAAREIA